MDTARVLLRAIYKDIIAFIQLLLRGGSTQGLGLRALEGLGLRVEGFLWFRGRGEVESKVLDMSRYRFPLSLLGLVGLIGSLQWVYRAPGLLRTHSSRRR